MTENLPTVPSDRAVVPRAFDGDMTRLMGDIDFINVCRRTGMVTAFPNVADFITLMSHAYALGYKRGRSDANLDRPLEESVMMRDEESIRDARVRR